MVNNIIFFGANNSIFFFIDENLTLKAFFLHDKIKVETVQILNISEHLIYCNKVYFELLRFSRIFKTPL